MPIQKDTIMDYSYTSDEIAYPPGMGPEDLAWTMFSWDLRIPESGMHVRNSWVRIVVAPGVMLIHRGSEREVRFSFTGVEVPGSLDVFQQVRASDSVMEQATKATQYYKPKYEMVNSPKPFVIDPDEFPEWSISYEVSDGLGVGTHHPVKTLGDALVYNEHKGTFQEVLNSVVTARQSETGAPAFFPGSTSFGLGSGYLGPF